MNIYDNISPVHELLEIECIQVHRCLLSDSVWAALSRFQVYGEVQHWGETLSLSRVHCPVYSVHMCPSSS